MKMLASVLTKPSVSTSFSSGHSTTANIKFEYAPLNAPNAMTARMGFDKDIATHAKIYETQKLHQYQQLHKVLLVDCQRSLLIKKYYTH